MDEHRQRILEARLAMAETDDLEEYLDSIDDSPKNYKPIDELIRKK